MMEIVMTFYRFKHALIEKTARFEITSDEPEFVEVCGNSVDEINEKVQHMRDNNDLVKYTPWRFVRLDSVEVKK